MDIRADDFQLVREHHIASLDVKACEYSHTPSGGRHFHLACDNPENAFVVMFRTIPENSTGVAHVLEHLVLNGSERFPVRDPFFAMMKRSLNTYMNALTGSDYTAYPFATTNRSDYMNLLAVYLDAVFHPRLHSLDFAQEGHRLEFKVPDDPTSGLIRKGVVYNEMKGDLSAPVSQLYESLYEAVYPTSTYHYNSGGDPDHIPLLTLDDLRAFHRRFYHPANAVFFSFGDIDPKEIHQQISASLHGWSMKDATSAGVVAESRFAQPKSVTSIYPSSSQDADQTHVVLAWLLGETTDLPELLRCHVMADTLLDTSASPLRALLEDFDPGRGVSPLCGIDEQNYEAVFMCGVEGTEPGAADELEARVLECLDRVARDGVSLEDLEATLHQLELSQREIGGDGTPYGLQLIFSCLPAAVHKGDVIDWLDLDEAIARLREEIRDPDFLSGLVQRYLIDNPHRVRLSLVPDSAEQARREAAEEAGLSRYRQAMSDSEVTQLIEQASALVQRQSTPDDLDLLPGVGVRDIPSSKRYAEARHTDDGIYSFAAGTNGLVYHQAAVPLTGLSDEQIQLLPLYSQLVTEVGSAGRGYLETQRLQYAETGGINVFPSVRACRDEFDEVSGYMVFSSRTLADKVGELLTLVAETIVSPDFDELERLKDLAWQWYTRRQGSITSNAHGLAMLAAASRLRPVPAYLHRGSGLGGYMNLGSLVNGLNANEGIEAFATSLSSLAETLAIRSPVLMTASEPGTEQVLRQQLRARWPDAGLLEASVSLGGLEDSGDVAFLTDSAVNFCAAVYPTIPETHPDGAALAVLAAILRNGSMHRMLREQGGAYGGGATHDAANGVFRFYSYRDPNLEQTFDQFDAAIDEVMTSGVTQAQVDEAILSIIAAIDAPGSPAGEAKLTFQHALHGRHQSHRVETRQRILGISADDVVRVASRYLSALPCRAVVTDHTNGERIQGDFELINLNEPSSG